MRQILLVLLLGGVSFGQTMVESAAAAAGGSAGGIGGKKVSDGLSGIFNKVNQQTGKAAKAAKEPAKAVKRVLPVSAATTPAAESVPPPPPAERHTLLHSRVEPVPEPVPAPGAEAAPPAPPEVTAAELHTVAIGMNRQRLLQLGEPTSRMMTSDDGHLIEVYGYKDGVVHLTDGAVSSINVHD